MVPFQVSPQRRSSSCPTCCRPLSPASTPRGSRGPLGALVGRIGGTARRPWGGPGCRLVWCRCPLRGGGGRGGAVCFLSLVFCVLVRGGSGGCRAGWYAVVRFLRFPGLLVGVSVRGRGCQ